MKTGIITIMKSGLLALGFFGTLATTASAAYFDNAPAPRCEVQITRTLQRGSEGVDVTILQNFLNRAGLLSAVPNGYFGPATAAAVRAFQYREGIAATGSVGPMTLNAINERMCDTDLYIDTFSNIYTDAYYGFASGVTYVDAKDPFVTVITPPVTTPAVYVNPQSSFPVTTTSVHTTGASQVTTAPIVPATTGGIASTNIIYSPSIGYTYGIVPASGTLTINNPRANAVYKEGDTVSLSWATQNITAHGYTILLENTSTGQSKAVTTTTGNSTSFVLTKELLDAVCAGTCTNPNFGTSYQGTFRIAVTTPLRDIAGNVSTFRATVSPITITRPFAGFGTVSLTASKTPVNNGELFKLYVNIPTGASWNANIYGQYAFKIRATCPSGVTASIAGVACGQDFSLPFSPSYLQQEIPVMVGNSTWYRQNVTFTLTVTNLQGQVIGTSDAVVQVNGAPFNW